MTAQKINKPNLSFWNEKKVLITGHTGFKGSWLALWLLQMNAKVYGISLDPESPKNLFDSLKIEKDINHIICDIRDKEKLDQYILESKPEIIFHLAAQPLVVKSYQEPIKTWEVNVIGTLNLLNSLTRHCRESFGIFITTDKVYQNNEWVYGYRENDRLGGYDPYSSSKAATELAISSWRSSFCNISDTNLSHFCFSSARAGNVIGGGDWAENRIIPDVVNSLEKNNMIILRNPNSTRPWQHVLEPLSGYLRLAEMLSFNKAKYSSSYNFGPYVNSNRTVKDLVDECLKYWDGKYENAKDINKLHEAGMLNLVIEKAVKELNWEPKWDFDTTIKKTICWYKKVFLREKSPLECSLDDLKAYLDDQ